MKKICIFAHFNKNNNLENYVMDYLNTLKNLVDEIIFVSTTDIKTDKMNILDSLVNKIIIKENRGYDFGSWREGLLFIKNNYQNIPEEIILCNDSCYISREKLIKAIKFMRGNKKLDFWGITKNYSFAIHIQSYFVALNSRPLNDDKFWDLVYSWKHQNRKIDYILKYEIGLTQFLLKEKYNIGSLINISLLKLLALTTKYKLIFIIQYFNNAAKYLIMKNFISNSSKDIQNIKELRSNLYLKKRSFKDILKGIRFFLDPFNTNITHLDLKDLSKINSPLLKVSEGKEILKNEDIYKLKTFCIKNGFDFNNIIKHQNDILED